MSEFVFSNCDDTTLGVLVSLQEFFGEDALEIHDAVVVRTENERLAEMIKMVSEQAYGQAPVALQAPVEVNLEFHSPSPAEIRAMAEKALICPDCGKPVKTGKKCMSCAMKAAWAEKRAKREAGDTLNTVSLAGIPPVTASITLPPAPPPPKPAPTPQVLTREDADRIMDHVKRNGAIKARKF